MDLCVGEREKAGLSVMWGMIVYVRVFANIYFFVFACASDFADMRVCARPLTVRLCLCVFVSVCVCVWAAYIV